MEIIPSYRIPPYIFEYSVFINTDTTRDAEQDQRSASSNKKRELKLIQDVMADGFKVELFELDPNNFPMSMIDPNEDIKPDLSQMSGQKDTTISNEILFGNLIYETNVSFFTIIRIRIWWTSDYNFLYSQ